MEVLFVLLISFVLLRGVGFLAVKRLASWRNAGLGALAIMFLFTSTAHFSGMKYDLAAMMPEPLPDGLWIIYLTGLFEIAGAMGLLIPRTRRLAGICLVLLLIAVFPANVNAALNGIPLGGEPPTPLWLRTPMQLLFIGMVWWTSIRTRPKKTEARKGLRGESQSISRKGSSDMAKGLRSTATGVPGAVQASFLLWLTAVGAGVVETIVRAIYSWSGGPESGGLLVRVIVYAVAVYIITQMRLGKRWARITLAVLLGGIGTLSLVIDPISWLVAGNGIGDIFAQADLLFVLVAPIRAVHLAAVIAAFVLMFLPAANAYFRRVSSDVTAPGERTKGRAHGSSR